jgi:sulfide:quinone oxidoreductase
MFRKLTDAVSVAPQIAADDIARAKAAGFVVIINNRPDGEAPEQPASADIATTARAAGLGYHHIPMAHGGITPQMIAAVRAALAEGPALMFCRSGTRSAMLWALARAAEGDAPDLLATVAASAGYDLSPIRLALDRLAERH